MRLYILQSTNWSKQPSVFQIPNQHVVYPAQQLFHQFQSSPLMAQAISDLCFLPQLRSSKSRLKQFWPAWLKQKLLFPTFLSHDNRHDVIILTVYNFYLFSTGVLFLTLQRQNLDITLVSSTFLQLSFESPCKLNFSISSPI